MYDQNTPECRYWAVRPLLMCLSLHWNRYLNYPASGSPHSHHVPYKGLALPTSDEDRARSWKCIRINTGIGNMCQASGDGRVCNFKDMPSLYLVGALH